MLFQSPCTLCDPGSKEDEKLCTQNAAFAEWSAWNLAADFSRIANAGIRIIDFKSHGYCVGAQAVVNLTRSHIF